MTPTDSDKTQGSADMESVLENVLETLGKSPELMELAGKLAGMPEVSPAPTQKPPAESNAALPKLLEMLTGQNNTAEKASAPEASDGSTRAIALLKALRPYMNAQRGDSVDRMLRVLPTARAIRTALHAFGSIQ